MLSRQIYIERGVTITALGLAPVIVAALGEPVSSFAALMESLHKLIILLPVLVAVGIGCALALHRRSRLGNISWGGMSETSALLKQAAGEFVAGNAENKLLNQANRAADDQEGRAAGLYFHARITQLRQSDSFKQTGASNPVPLGKRLFWILLLTLCSALYLGWPAAHLLGIPAIVTLGLSLLLFPIFVTALAILGFGARDADAWLRAIFRLRLPQREIKGSIRKREVASVAGQWHKRSRGPEIPVFRGTLGVILATAATVYALRNYGDDLFGRSTDPYETEPVATATPPPRPTAKPQATPRKTTSAPAVRSGAPARPPQPQIPATPQSKVPANGILIAANIDELTFAGWDVQQLDLIIRQYKRERLDEWYLGYRHEVPTAQGRVHLRVTLLAQGTVGEVRSLGGDFGERFVYGVIDRLQAMDLGSSALDPVTLTLTLDFRP